MRVGALNIDVYERMAFAGNAGIVSHGQRSVQARAHCDNRLDYLRLYGVQRTRKVAGI